MYGLTLSDIFNVGFSDTLGDSKRQGYLQYAIYPFFKSLYTCNLERVKVAYNVPVGGMTPGNIRLVDDNNHSEPDYKGHHQVLVN